MTNVADLMNEWLGNIEDDERLPFKLRVGCVKMAAPRHERFEYLINMGRSDVDRVFENKQFYSKNLTFVFPEQFMGVHEQQSFMNCLISNVYIDAVESVDIITSSPLLIGNIHREHIMVLTWPDDHKHNGEIKQ